jgi:hypothetical protein
MHLILRRLHFRLLFGATLFAFGQPPDPLVPNSNVPADQDDDSVDSEYGPHVESGTGLAHEGGLPSGWSDDDWIGPVSDAYGDGDGDGDGDGCP